MRHHKNQFHFNHIENIHQEEKKMFQEGGLKQHLLKVQVINRQKLHGHSISPFGSLSDPEHKTLMLHLLWCVLFLCLEIFFLSNLNFSNIREEFQMSKKFYLILFYLLYFKVACVAGADLAV